MPNHLFSCKEPTDLYVVADFIPNEEYFTKKSKIGQNTFARISSSDGPDSVAIAKYGRDKTILDDVFLENTDGETRVLNAEGFEEMKKFCLEYEMDCEPRDWVEIKQFVGDVYLHLYSNDGRDEGHKVYKDIILPPNFQNVDCINNASYFREGELYSYFKENYPNAGGLDYTIGFYPIDESCELDYVEQDRY